MLQSSSKHKRLRGNTPGRAPEATKISLQPALPDLEGEPFLQSKNLWVWLILEEEFD